MAGGTFDKLAGKVRPGTYTNFETTKHDTLGISERGTVVLPLTNHTYGPVGEFVELLTEAPDSKPEILGYSIYDEDENRQMLLIREAFKRAARVYIYRLNDGTKATVTKDGITATAAYPGSRGNKLTYSILANPVEGFDLEINLDGNKVAYVEKVKTVEDLNAQNYIYFTGTYTGEGAQTTTTTGTGSTTRYNYIEELDAADEGSPAGNGYYEEDDTSADGYKLTTDTEPVEGKSYYSREEIEVFDDDLDEITETTTTENATTLPLVAGVNLENGTDEAMKNGDVSAFLDKVEQLHFNALFFPITDASLQSAAKTKIKYIRESIGRGVIVVMPDTLANNYEGVISVTNSVQLGDDKLTHAEACAWVAAAEASASNTKGLTYEEYEGATAVVDPKTHEEAEAAINNGEFFFSMSESGAVIVEYDINTLTDFSGNKDESYRKNRVIRVFDTFMEAVQLNFPPNKYNNSPTGWDIMEGIGKAILKSFEEAGAIKNVDYNADFIVDRAKSEGDKTFFNVGLEAVDGAEKLYFTISTR